MIAILRQFRRAPGRILASIFALALAVGAIGVFAVPSVSSEALDQVVQRDGLADVLVDTTPMTHEQLLAIRAIDGVVAAEAEISAGVTLRNGGLARVIGLDLADQTMDVVHVESGRLPTAPGEVLADPEVGGIGDVLILGGQRLSIVGSGSTLWWNENTMIYTDLATAGAFTPDGGTNRLVITAIDDSSDSLRSIGRAVRSSLEAEGDTFTTFPVYLPDGSTPIDADIEQVSALIGLLGVFAGLVALVLLASTTNTLISERTREVAVMRALGGRQRPLRRRLRRIAVGIVAVALMIGLPLGVLISNLIARMVLEEFVGITPDVTVDWRVLVGSAIGALLGARLIAARAARRVTRLPLAAALRDRDGFPFGLRWTHRLAARSTAGGLFGRLAGRSIIHRPGRTITVIAQISAAVGAAFLVPTLVTSVNEFNTASHASWTWESSTVARDAGLPFSAAVADDIDGAETAIVSAAEIDEWEVEVYGLAANTEMFAPTIDAGRWWEPAARQLVVSSGFAERRGIDVGESVTLELAAGSATYEVVGTVDDFGRAVYLDRDVLASDVGEPGMANAIWSTSARPTVDLPVAVRTSTAAQIVEDDQAGRQAIVMIFGAIGAIVAAVAALSVLSSMTVSLFDRRHELAALQAVGASRWRLRGLLLREMVPLGAAGIVGGLVLGGLGARGIIASFEASNAVDIGVLDATGAIPFIAAGTFVALTLLALAVVRSAARRPVAVTLRGAA